MGLLEPEQEERAAKVGEAGGNGGHGSGIGLVFINAVWLLAVIFLSRPVV
jgi:hypothetical protein